MSVSQEMPRQQVLQLPYGWEPWPRQWPLWNALCSGQKRACVVWHRKFGKSLFFWNWIIRCAATKPGLYWHVFPAYSQGKKTIWDGYTNDGRKFLDFIPPQIYLRQREDEMSVWVQSAGGKESKIQIVGTDNPDSLRGPNPIGVVMDEYAVQDPIAWDIIRPILKVNGGWAAFVFTPNGKNHGFKLFNMAQQDPEWFSELLTVDDTGVVTPEQIEQERREGMLEELIQQEFYCLPPGSRVFSDRGQVPIERVQPGDRVLSHKGRWRAVRSVMSRDVAEPLVEIVSFGDNAPVRATANHPVRLVEPATQTYRWVPAEDVKSGDWVTMPALRSGAAVVERQLALLVAWFIAEGSGSMNSVQFTLGHGEHEYAAEILAAAQHYGWRGVAQPADTGLQVRVHSTQLLDLLSSRCGSGAAAKHIPWDLVAGHEAIVLDRLIRGDGCEIRNGWAYTTVSESLAYDVQLLAATCGYGSGISRRRGGAGTIQGRTVTQRPSFCVRISTTPSNKLRPTKYGVAARVRRVERLPYAGPVYNLSVQYDESFVANGRVVHNCSWDTALAGAYYADQLALAEREKRITEVPYDPARPVITSWDLGTADATAIWFWQQHFGGKVCAIDYYEAFGQPLDHYVKLLAEKPYVYQHDLVPHDSKQRVMTGKTVYEALQTLGRRPQVVQSIGVQDGIQALRALFPRIWFDAEKCADGITALREYTKKYDRQKHEFLDVPSHGWASHGADSARYYAVGMREIRPPRDRLKAKVAVV